MRDYERFETRKDAQERASEMRGYLSCKAVAILEYNHWTMDDETIWVVQVQVAKNAEPQFLRSDGYVR